MASRIQTIVDSYLEHLRIPEPLRNKYVVVSVVFALWILFGAEASLMSQLRLRHTRDELRTQKSEYQAELKRVLAEHQQLNHPEYRERLAREQYYMKRRNEDVFVFVTE